MGPRIVPDESVSLEDGVLDALDAMRRRAADPETEFTVGEYAKALLDRRPLVLLAVAEKGSTTLWAFAPGLDESAEGVMMAHVECVRRQDKHNARERYPRAQWAWKGFLLHEIERRIDWLVNREANPILTEGLERGRSWGSAR